MWLLCWLATTRKATTAETMTTTITMLNDGELVLMDAIPDVSGRIGGTQGMDRIDFVVSVEGSGGPEGL